MNDGMIERALPGSIVERIIVTALACLAMSACTLTKPSSSTGFAPPGPDRTVLMVEPEVVLGVYTMGGLLDYRESWSVEARENIVEAIRVYHQAIDTDVRLVTEPSPATQGADFEELRALYRIVIAAAVQHTYRQHLPSKEQQLAWTLGEAAVDLGEASGHDYLLFTHVIGLHSSPGRMAMQTAGWIACAATSICLAAPGGHRFAVAALFDLSTGELVWVNYLSSEDLNPRKEGDAYSLVRSLFKPLVEGDAG